MIYNLSVNDLYGFPEFQLKEDSIDEETLNYILVFVGIMFGVQDML